MISSRVRTHVFGIFLLSAIVAFIGCNADSGSGSESNSIDINLGTILIKDKVCTDVRFKNPFPDTFQIKEIRTSCTCSVIGNFPAQVASNESVSIPLELNLARFAARAAAKPYPLEFRLLLLGRGTNMVVNVSTVLESPIQCDDPKIDVGERLFSDAGQQIFTKTFSIYNHKLKVEPECDKSKLNVELKRDSSGRCELTAVLKEPVEPGPLAETIRLICWNENDIVSEFPIAVTGNLLPEFFTKPEYLDFGLCQKSTKETGDVVCQSRSGLDFQIDNAVWSSDGSSDIKIEKMNGSAGSYRIQIAFCPVKTGPYEDRIELTIRQSNGDQLKVIVPVRAYVSELYSEVSHQDATQPSNIPNEESPSGR